MNLGIGVRYEGAHAVDHTCSLHYMLMTVGSLIVPLDCGWYAAGLCAHQWQEFTATSLVDKVGVRYGVACLCGYALSSEVAI
jgi:hypothetical protein